MKGSLLIFGPIGSRLPELTGLGGARGFHAASSLIPSLAHGHRCSINNRCWIGFSDYEWH